VDNVNMLVGLRIKTVREALGVTQAALAKSAGLQRTQLTMIETGRSGCRIVHLVNIAKALNVKPARFLP
jgi:DNA-binding XRE family transcriptional regulator